VSSAFATCKSGLSGGWHRNKAIVTPELRRRGARSHAPAAHVQDKARPPPASENMWPNARASSMALPGFQRSLN
jgi:hypothetical protein